MRVFTSRCFYLFLVVCWMILLLIVTVSYLLSVSKAYVSSLSWNKMMDIQLNSFVVNCKHAANEDATSFPSTVYC